MALRTKGNVVMNDPRVRYLFYRDGDVIYPWAIDYSRDRPLFRSSACKKEVRDVARRSTVMYLATGGGIVVWRRGQKALL